VIVIRGQILNLSPLFFLKLILIGLKVIPVQPLDRSEGMPTWIIR
jgi:hypothetical protein